MDLRSAVLLVVGVGYTVQVTLGLPSEKHSVVLHVGLQSGQRHDLHMRIRWALMIRTTLIIPQRFVLVQSIYPPGGNCPLVDNLVEDDKFNKEKKRRKEKKRKDSTDTCFLLA